MTGDGKESRIGFNVPTHLLPSVNDILVSQQPFPGQGGDLCSHTRQGVLALKQLLALFGQGHALCNEVVANQAESAVRKSTRADVEVAGVAGTETEGAVGEAMFGDVSIRGG